MNSTRKHHRPTYLEIRDRIERIGRDWEVGDLKELPKDSDSEQYRLALMFQLLMAARISEVCGPYLVRTEDMFEIKIKGEPAALFAVRTAKRKGKPRPSTIPLNPEYEPWAPELVEYFRKCDCEHPFMFHENVEATSKRYLMWVAKEAFKGMMWPMAEYTRKVDVPYEPRQIIKETYDDLMYPEYIVELNDGKRYKTRDKNIVQVPEKIFGRWKPVTSHVMRKRRTRTLFDDYFFDGYDLAAYGGWTEKSQVEATPGALKFYLETGIESAKENLGLLRKMAARYFGKLLIPFDELFKTS